MSRARTIYEKKLRTEYDVCTNKIDLHDCEFMKTKLKVK